MNFPSELKYTEEHEWVRINGDGTATVGITDFAQQELGELVYVEVDTLEETLDQGDVFGTVEAVKTTSDLFMPISGKVIEFNSILDDTQDDNPGAINEEPYGEGWIVKIEITNEEELASLMDAAKYEELTSES
ncbi:MAG: glycine cleavage system protein GcvH [Bacteroidota bacterium]